MAVILKAETVLAFAGGSSARESDTIFVRMAERLNK
jgi:hypothetical protein